MEQMRNVARDQRLAPPQQSHSMDGMDVLELGQCRIGGKRSSQRAIRLLFETAPHPNEKRVEAAPPINIASSCSVPVTACRGDFGGIVA